MLFLRVVLFLKVPEVLIQNFVLLYQFFILFSQLISIIISAAVVLVLNRGQRIVFFLVRTLSSAC